MGIDVTYRLLNRRKKQPFVDNTLRLKSSPSTLECNTRTTDAGWPIRLHNVCKSRGGRRVLCDVNLEVSSGEVVAICGPSGAGKSTLLRVINALEPIDSGEITVGPHPLSQSRGKTLRSLRSNVGIVFQQFNLYPHKTVLENVSLAPRLVHRISQSEAVATALTLLERVGLSHLQNAYPSQLSGGEQQRVAIARSLAMRPKALLLDEPTASLDRELTVDVLHVLAELAGEGRTIILCTHELEFAETIAQKLVFMDAGKILEIGAPEQILRRPNHERTISFMNKLLSLPQASGA